MSEKIKLNSRVIELNEEKSNDIFMSLTMCILTNQVNLNNAQFTDGFINNIVNNKEKYIGIPLVANRIKLENGVYESLSHELDKNSGTLNTDMVGSFTDFFTQTDEEGSLLLMGNVKVFKRFPNVCNALMELYTSGDLEFSCECIVYNYESVKDGVRVIGENSGELFASAVVSDPAEVKSRATLLIAEAYEQDLSKEVNIMDEQKETITNLNSLVSEKETEISKLQEELMQVKEELTKMSEVKSQEVLDLESTMQELNSKISELEVKVTELNSTIVSQEETKTELEAKVTELNSEIETLKPFKEAVETAEKEKAITELSSRYEKLLSEETFKSERVQEAIQKLDSIELNSVVVEEIAKEKTAVETASVKDDTVTIVASKQEDLVTPSKHEFWALPSQK